MLNMMRLQIEEDSRTHCAEGGVSWRSIAPGLQAAMSASSC